MAFAASLILPLLVVLLGLVALCYDPADVGARPVRKPERAADLPARLLDGRLDPYQIDGRDPHSAMLPRRYVVRARNAGDATLKARRWGLHVDRIERLG